MADAGVRPATLTDTPAMAQVQVHTWRDCYGRILPSAALASLTVADSQAAWRAAVSEPPSPRHRVLVAVEHGELVGFTAVAPATDPDLDHDTTAELMTLLVQPEAHRRGHGSRLLAAAVDTMREDGFDSAVAWVFDTDAAMEAFLESAGWALDGAGRELAMADQQVHQGRLHTALRG